MRRKRMATVIIIILILIGSTLLYYFSIVPPPPGSPFVTEFPTNSNSYPNAIAVDGQGRVWFALQKETALGMLYPSNGTIKTFPLPESGNPGLETWGIAIDYARGLVWLTDHISNAIWSFNVTSLAFTKHAIPTNDSFPFQIALDSKGNVWFTESFAGKLGEFTSQGMMKEYAIPQNGTGIDPSGLAIANETIWFTEPDSNVIGSFSNGSFKLYNTTGYIYSPVGIAVGSNGNLWVTQHTYPGLISEYDPSNQNVMTFSTSYLPEYGTSLPYFIHVDPSGDVWFNEHYGNSIAKFSPASNTLVEYYVPLRHPVQGNLSYILTSALSESGEPWFTELFTGNIGTINNTMPVVQTFSFANQSTYQIANGSSLTLNLVVNGGGALSVYLGNFTQGLGFSFSPQSGDRTFTSKLVIQNNGSESGTYVVTVSDATQYITFSRIMEITVP